MTRRSLPLFMCLLTAISTQAQNPGNIGTTNLMFWFRGDAGLTPGSTFTWTDQSGNGRNGTQATSANQPTVTNTAADYMNYNSGIKVNGSQWLIMSGGANGMNSAGTTADEIYLVYNKLTGSSDGMVMGINDPGNRSYYFGSGVVQLGNAGKPSTAAPGYINNGNNLFVGKYFSATDGGQAANGASFAALTPLNDPATLAPPVGIGVQPNGSGGKNGFGYSGTIMELVGYNAEIDQTGILRQRVESYLALKYGITLDSVGTGGKYYNSLGNAVYQGGGGTGYFTNIIGIARDDNTALYQRQSHLPNDSVRLYMGATPLSAATNGTNTATFSADRSYIVMGDNAGKFCGNNSQKPVTVDERLDREWKVTYNHLTDAFNMDVTLASCAPFSSGTGDPNDLELLYSTTSSNLSTGTVMMNNTNGMTISLSSGGIVTIAGLNSALASMAPATAGGTTVYFTLASNHYLVLPLELTDFTASAAGHSVVLDWTMADQTDVDHFAVMRSADGTSWQTLGEVSDYNFLDSLPLDGISFYRLQIVGKSGAYSWSPVRTVNLQATSALRLFPNPATDQVYISASGLQLDETTIGLYSISGVALPLRATGGVGLASVDLSGLAPGIYLVRVKTPAGWQLLRLLKQ